MHRGAITLLALTLAGACAWAQPATVRPQLAWTEPGQAALYGLARILPDGGAAQCGEPFAWDWLLISPEGRFVAYWRQGEAALHIADTSAGTDRIVPDFPFIAADQLQFAEWAGGTLWLLLRAGPNETPTLAAVAAAIPTAVGASGALRVEKVAPTRDGAAAYALARVGSAESSERALALCFADGRAPRQLGERERVVGGRIVESEDRVAYFATRSDRAGYALSVCDRETGQVVGLNPEAGAFQPIFSRGFRQAAYTTRRGIVVQELGGAPTLVAPHLPDRRFALSYHLSPIGNALLVETPTDAKRETRVLTRYPLGRPGAPEEILRVAAPASAGGATVTFADDGAHMLVSVPGASAGGAAFYVGRAAEGALVRAGEGRLIASAFAPSGAAVALVTASPGAPSAELRVVPTEGPPAEAAAAGQPSARLAVRARGDDLECPGLSLRFAPAGERLLLTALTEGASRPSALIVETPGAPARALSADYVVRSAFWGPEGRSVLLDVLAGWGGPDQPVTSLLSVAPSSPAPAPVALSGSLRLVRLAVAPDGSVTAVAQLQPPTRRLVISRAARESLAISGDVDADDPIWSPDGGSLVFRSPIAQPPFSSLYVARPETRPVLVSGELLVEDRPQWLPDGKRLYFTAVRRAPEGGAVRVGCLASAGGGAPRELGPMDRVRLLPDRSGIVFHAGGSKPGIYTLRFDDPAGAALLAEGYDGALPSPDGARTLLIRDLPTGLAGAIVPMAGGAPQPLAGPPYARIAWAPDGRRLAAVTADDAETLVLLAEDGREIARPGEAVADIAWSDAGDRIAALCAPSEGQAAVQCWSADGALVGRGAWPPTLRPFRAAPPALAVLLEVPKQQLAWSPDAKAVLSFGNAEDGTVTGRVLLPATQESYPLGVDGSVAGFGWAPSSGLLGIVTYQPGPPDAGGGVGATRSLRLGDVVQDRFAVVPGATDIEGFAWLADGRISYWTRAGDGDSTGTFVANTDGTGLFRLGAAPAAPPQGAVWPSATPRERAEIVWRRAQTPVADEGGA